jgi:hypothetical protein
MYGLTLAANGMANVEPDACSNFYKPIEGDEMPISKYFGGGGQQVMQNMAKQYGKKKGKQVFYATANKRKQLDTAPKNMGKKMGGVDY